MPPHRRRITCIPIMTSARSNTGAAVLYVCAAGLLWRGLSAATPCVAAPAPAYSFRGGALALHAGLLYSDLFHGGLNLASPALPRSWPGR